MKKKQNLYFICLDIGGTNIRGTWVSSDGECGELVLIKRPKELEGTKEAILDLIYKIKSLCPYEIKGIGVASAGPLDFEKKIYLKTANMPEVDFFPIGAFLEEKFSCPILLENDAQAAALGEIYFGCLQGEKHGITITLGTGVGTGVVINRKIWRALHITGPELGHIYLGGDRECGCGQIGCAETLLNREGLILLAKKYGLSIQRTKELYEMAKTQDPKAVKVLKEFGGTLGLFISVLQTVFGIKNICISGGMSRVVELCLDAVWQTLNERFKQRKWWLPHKILISKEPNLSALYGMGVLLKECFYRSIKM
jgi:glucokinase